MNKNPTLVKQQQKVYNVFMRTLAQSLNIGGQQIQGPLNQSSKASELSTVGGIVNAFLNVLFPVALFILFIYLVWAGFDMARSMGNPETLKKAKARLTNAVIGMILLGVSYWAAEIAVKIFWGQ